ncbi:hypothetical protein V7014_19185 [Bacillus sp. JJ722]
MKTLLLFVTLTIPSLVNENTISWLASEGSTLAVTVFVLFKCTVALALSVMIAVGGVWRGVNVSSLERGLSPYSVTLETRYLY